ncbi:hypothetical protein MSAN_02326200 [Mycena sanguinolenta]|uniref:Uncharacterized protein n=1 Tax=Mycena sanguinolenta TaxID=230812 RepID=A0A8H7CH88_9AGAR|nr:hypothetical protein MSAN_02326200 [Mycena sanguinolenta]
MASLTFDAWATTPNSTIVLAGNTKQVPDIPRWNSNLDIGLPRPCIDGRWGLSEYSIVPQPFDPKFPYLAWMPTHNFARLGLRTKINQFRVIEDTGSPNSVFVRNSGWMHRGHLRTEIREELQQDVVHYIDLVNDIIRREADPSSRVGSEETRPPVIALVRAHNSAFCTRFAYLTFRDLLEYIAGLQRSVAELQAYSMWHDRMHYGDLPSSNRSFELGLRGSIAHTPEEYNDLKRLGVPVWLEIPSADGYGLDAGKETKVIQLQIETRTWNQMQVSPFLRDLNNGCLAHNKPLEYYPPMVADVNKYEAAARGYWPREDKLRRDLRCATDVMSMLKNIPLSGENHNQSTALAKEVRDAGAVAGELMEQYAADRAIAPTAEVVMPATAHSNSTRGGKSKWLRQFLDTKTRYDNTPWAPKFIDPWCTVRHNSDYYPLVHDIKLEPKSTQLLLYIAPLHTCSLALQNRRKCTTHSLSGCASDDLGWHAFGTTFQTHWCGGITTQQWRDVLSGQYWKLRHPCNTEPAFELRKFWRNGGPLIFEDDEATAAEDDISPEFPGSLTGRLEPGHLGDDKVKALILWDLALCHSQLQLDRADEILYAAHQEDGVHLTIRRTRRADVFHDPKWHWRIPKELPPWEKPLSDPARRHWLSRLLEVVRYWPSASKMGWFLAEQGFDKIKPVSGKRIEAIFCNGLGEGKLHALEMALVAVYYQGVFDALGILAIGLTKRPTESAEMEPFFLM